MIGTSFLRVAAHDDDFGTNAAIMYSMSAEQPEYLRVNPLTGWVYVNQPISQVDDVFFFFFTVLKKLMLGIEPRSAFKSEIIFQYSSRAYEEQTFSFLFKELEK